jgi:hypothetical protein
VGAQHLRQPVAAKDRLFSFFNARCVPDIQVYCGQTKMYLLNRADFGAVLVYDQHAIPHLFQ